MISIGIDPGLGGGFAALNASGGVICLEPTPATVKAPREYLEQRMAGLVLGVASTLEGAHATIEAQQAMPGQGVRSMFTIGLGYGLWRGILSANSVPYAIMRPQAWRKVLGLAAGADKGASVALAMRLFPSVADRLVGPKGGLRDGLAEALLIAEAGRRTVTETAAAA